jgi:Putative transmembrane protein (PGPGW)
MAEKLKNYTLSRPRLKKAVGYFLVLVGFVALVTPLTPGAFLLIIGLELLGIRMAFFDRFMPKKKAKTETLPAMPEVAR